MSHKKLTALLGCALVALQWLATPSAFAVGNGVGFVFREGAVPGAMVHPVPANSLDLTYHSCVDFDAINPGVFNENGYFWVSSFQDVDSVVDSQINDWLPNGYHLYAIYRFKGELCDGSETCRQPRQRREYGIHEARIELYLDPLSNTTLANPGCGAVVRNFYADDGLVGTADLVIDGQKTETNDLANGDFEIVFGNWVFTPLGQALFWDGMGAPLSAPIFVYNANITQVLGPLNADHRAEGSGNIFWRD
jgi:hypothetical protein